MKPSYIATFSSFALITGTLFWQSPGKTQGFCYLVDNEGRTINLDQLCQQRPETDASQPQPEVQPGLDQREEATPEEKTPAVRGYTIIGPAIDAEAADENASESDLPAEDTPTNSTELDSTEPDSTESEPEPDRVTAEEETPGAPSEIEVPAPETPPEIQVPVPGATPETEESDPGNTDSNNTQPSPEDSLDGDTTIP